jgi:DNA-binding response OmpR family regulator
MMAILVVEDEPRVASFVMKGLRARGYEVAHAICGEEALARWTSEIDLILLDLGLPDIDGLEVLRRLRRAGGAPPVIILSARSSDEDWKTGMELGASDYVAKPFGLDDLTTRIGACLAKSRNRSKSEV